MTAPHDLTSQAAIILHEHERRDREEQERLIVLLGRRLDHAHHALRQLSTLLLGRYTAPQPLPALPVPLPPALEVMAPQEAEEPLLVAEVASPAPAPAPVPPRPARPAAPPPAPIRVPVPQEAQSSPTLVPDPGPTVAHRRPVILALADEEAAKSCRGWPGYESQKATLDPVIDGVVSLLREVEAAAQQGDVHALRDIAARKLTQGRSGVAARCRAALDTLLTQPAQVAPPAERPRVIELVEPEPEPTEAQEETPVEPEPAPVVLDPLSIECPA